jgi:hypothetical protein
MALDAPRPLPQAPDAPRPLPQAPDAPRPLPQARSSRPGNKSIPPVKNVQVPPDTGSPRRGSPRFPPLCRPVWAFVPLRPGNTALSVFFGFWSPGPPPLGRGGICPAPAREPRIGDWATSRVLRPRPGTSLSSLRSGFHPPHGLGSLYPRTNSGPSKGRGQRPTRRRKGRRWWGHRKQYPPAPARPNLSNRARRPLVGGRSSGGGGGGETKGKEVARWREPRRRTRSASRQS